MWGNSCVFCGREHDLAKRENCPTFGRSCNKWTRTKAKVYCFKDELSDEVFGVQEILAVMLDDSQLVIPKLESGNYLRFQPNTGDQCNVRCSFASIQESH